MVVLLAERGERLGNPEGMQGLYFVPHPWNRDFSKWIKICPQLWGEGSLARMSLEGYTGRWSWGEVPGPVLRRGHWALLKRIGALTWTLQGARDGS